MFLLTVFLTNILAIPGFVSGSNGGRYGCPRLGQHRGRWLKLGFQARLKIHVTVRKSLRILLFTIHSYETIAIKQ